MNREMKLGLIVGTSFLSLAAVVAISHWNKTEETGVPEPGQAAFADVKPPTTQPPARQQNIVAAGFNPQDPGGAPKPKDSAKFGQEEPKHRDGTPGKHEQPAFPPTLPVASAPASPPGGPPGFGQQPSPSGAPSFGQPPSPQNLGSSLNPAVPTPPGPGQQPLYDAPVPGADLTAPGAHGGHKQEPTFNGFPPLPAAPNPLALPETPPVGGFPPGGPVAVQVPQPTPPFDPTPIPKGPIAVAGPTERHAPPMDIPGSAPMPKTEPLMPGFDSKQPAPLGPGANFDPNFKAPPANQFPGNDFKAPVNNGPIPMVSMEGGMNVPPITMPRSPTPAHAPSGAASKSLDAYDARRYVCQPGDVDFSAVSAKIYHDPKLGQALQAFNGKDGSNLQPNAEIYYPSKEVLERKYPQLVTTNPVPSVPSGGGENKAPGFVYQNPGSGSPVPPSTASMGGWGTPPTGAPAPRTAPPIQPLAPVPAPSNAGPIASSPSYQGVSSAAYKVYMVPPGGKQFYEIARDTLGNGSRWSEIYNLNTNFDPQNIVPAGAQLRLPADARTGQ